MRNKLDKPIAMAREVVLKQSLNERFIEAFTQQIALNPKYACGEPEVSFFAKKMKYEYFVGNFSKSEEESRTKVNFDCYKSKGLQKFKTVRD